MTELLSCYPQETVDSEFSMEVPAVEGSTEQVEESPEARDARLKREKNEALVQQWMNSRFEDRTGVSVERAVTASPIDLYTGVTSPRYKPPRF